MSEQPKDEPKEIQIKAIKSPNFRTIIADRFFGGIDSMGLKAKIFSEQTDIENVINTEDIKKQQPILVRTIECELIIKPEQMKAFHLWLEGKIEEYETVYGKIPSPEEVSKRAEKFYHSKSEKNQDLR